MAERSSKQTDYRLSLVKAFHISRWQVVDHNAELVDRSRVHQAADRELLVKEFRRDKRADRSRVHRVADRGQLVKEFRRGKQAGYSRVHQAADRELLAKVFRRDRLPVSGRTEDSLAVRTIR